MMSVAFTREESAETAAEVELPDRPISPHANLVTASGPEALANAMAEYRAAYNAAHQIEDVTERRRARPRWPSVRIPSAPPAPSGELNHAIYQSLSWARSAMRTPPRTPLAPPKNAWMPRDRVLSPRREPEAAVIASDAKANYEAMPKAA